MSQIVSSKDKHLCLGIFRIDRLFVVGTFFVASLWYFGFGQKCPQYTTSPMSQGGSTRVQEKRQRPKSHGIGGCLLWTMRRNLRREFRDLYDRGGNAPRVGYWLTPALVRSGRRRECTKGRPNLRTLNRTLVWEPREWEKTNRFLTKRSFSECVLRSRVPDEDYDLII